MTIEPVQSLDLIDFSGFSHRLAAWEQEKETALPTSFLEQPGSICLFLGPEGGLHSDDLQLLRQWAFITFSLGSKILRGETAALAAMAIVQYLTGSLQPSKGAAVSVQALVS
jgi:16S rRNA (uracil1498-N3)-methyltransferase